MADFSNVTTSYDQATQTVSIAGQATQLVDTPVHITETITAGDGTTETLEADGTRAIPTPVATNLTSVTDDLGGVYVIAADGQSATLQ
jgi:hypothetical protein